MDPVAVAGDGELPSQSGDFENDPVRGEGEQPDAGEVLGPQPVPAEPVADRVLAAPSLRLPQAVGLN